MSKTKQRRHNKIRSEDVRVPLPKPLPKPVPYSHGLGGIIAVLKAKAK